MTNEMSISDYAADNIAIIKLTKTTTDIIFIIHEAQFIIMALMRDMPSGYREDVHTVSEGTQELRREIKRRKVKK